MKGFCPLASGSKGNCIYLGTDKTKILIDAGLSAKATIAALAEIHVDLSEIQAIVITHEHSDHILGLKRLCWHFGIPIICNMETAKGIAAAFGRIPHCKIFATGENFEIGDIQLHPFSIQHDTADPVAFTAHVGSLKLGICADLGFASSLVIKHLSHCDYLYLESNHDEELVRQSARPLVYKQRVLGRMGHLSNTACADIIDQVAHEGLKQIYLAHLSEECNRVELALKTIQNTLIKKNLQIPTLIAEQKKRTAEVRF